MPANSASSSFLMSTPSISAPICGPRRRTFMVAILTSRATPSRAPAPDVRCPPSRRARRAERRSSGPSYGRPRARRLAPRPRAHGSGSARRASTTRTPGAPSRARWPRAASRPGAHAPGPAGPAEALTEELAALKRTARRLAQMAGELEIVVDEKSLLLEEDDDQPRPLGPRAGERDSEECAETRGRPKVTPLPVEAVVTG